MTSSEPIPADDWPVAAQAAWRIAEERGFTKSCLPDVGRLLAMLTATVSHGTVGEIGSGTGFAAAWMAAARQPGVAFVTVEQDADLAAVASSVLDGQADVRVLHADWRDLLEYGPFALLFVDAAPAKQDVDAVVAALAPGGMVLLDDLTPIEQWPPEWRGKPDPVRDAWLNHPLLIATEIRTTPPSAAILAVRRTTAATA